MRSQAYVTIICCFAIADLSAQVSINDILAEWNNKKYDRVISSINTYYSKNTPVLKLDLMKISSMCQLGISPPSTSDCFDYIIKSYKIDIKTKQWLEVAKNNCIIPLNELEQQVVTATTELPRIAGKMGNTTRQREMERSGDTAKLIRYISPEQLQLRRVPDSVGTDAALRKFSSFYDSAGLDNVRFKIVDKFVIAYARLTLAAGTISTITSKLKKYYDFYVNELGMKPSRDYIHVFLAENYDELKDISEKLYGFRPPSYTLGYSSLEDRSIVSIAYVPEKPLLGTTCHELFHILCKNTFESLAPWLEEGMASLYEVSEQRGDVVKGMNNWRIQFLKKRTPNSYHKVDHFRLSDIINMTWQEFNRKDGDEANQSFNYAYSRYVMLFLQEKGKLKEFFKEAANYGYMDIKEGIVPDNIRIVEKYSNTAGNFDPVFRQWLQQQALLYH